jgi:hypothetical protein
MTNLKHISELISLARIIVDEDTWGGDQGHEPLKKPAIEALFRAWEEQAVEETAETKASQARRGEDVKETLAIKFSTEDKQIVLLIASAIHDEIQRSLAGTFYRSQKRSKNMDRLAVALASKGSKQHPKPKKLEFSIEDAISRSSNVTRLNSSRSSVKRVKPRRPDRTA